MAETVWSGSGDNTKLKGLIWILVVLHQDGVDVMKPAVLY